MPRVIFKGGPLNGETRVVESSGPYKVAQLTAVPSYVAEESLDDTIEAQTIEYRIFRRPGSPDLFIGLEADVAVEFERLRTAHYNHLQRVRQKVLAQFEL